MTPSTSAINTFILLCYLPPFLHVRGYNGNNAQENKCQHNYYLQKRQGKMACQRCTQECDANKNQMEVSRCSRENNRICFCKPGFYCRKENNYDTHCHKACVPCVTGTFSSKPSLDHRCEAHKDCALLGQKMLKEGTATQNRECVLDTTSVPTMSTPAVALTTSSSDIITTSSTNADTTRSLSSLTTLPFNTTMPSKTIMPISLYGTSTSSAGGTASLKDMSDESQSHWLLLFLLLFILLFMTGFCMVMKGKTKKTLSKCFGFINGKHEDLNRCRQTAGQHHTLCNIQSQTMESERPLCSDVRKVKGQSTRPAPLSGGVQQVTMEHNGKGENVSNNVGTIYIYSPGTVILGSNSGDKKEEAGVCEEDVPLISTPQQESNPPSQEIRITVSPQEEAEEELSLSFPVPATGK